MLVFPNVQPMAEEGRKAESLLTAGQKKSEGRMRFAEPHLACTIYLREIVADNPAGFQPYAWQFFASREDGLSALVDFDIAQDGTPAAVSHGCTGEIVEHFRAFVDETEALLPMEARKRRFEPRYVHIDSLSRSAFWLHDLDANGTDYVVPDLSWSGDREGIQTLAEYVRGLIPMAQKRIENTKHVKPGDEPVGG